MSDYSIHGGNFFDDLLGTVSNTINTVASTAGHVVGTAADTLGKVAPVAAQLAPLLLMAAGAHVHRLEHHLGLPPITKAEMKHHDTHNKGYWRECVKDGMRHNRNLGQPSKKDIRYLIKLIARMKRVLAHINPQN